MKSVKGFTLIELMIVIAIIGILAAIAISLYQDYNPKAQMSEALEISDGLKTRVTEVYWQYGSCPLNGTNGIAAATDINGKYVASVTTAGTGSATGGCTIQALMNSSGVATGIQGATLTLTMSTTATAGSYTWACTSSALQKYVPKACVGV